MAAADSQPQRRRSPITRVAIAALALACSLVWTASAVAAEGDVSVALVKDINTTSGDSNPGITAGFFNNSGVVLFPAFRSTAEGTELWKSDGTPGGTALVQDINPDMNEGSSPGLFASIGSLVFFRASDGATPTVDHGEELWKSNSPFMSAGRITDLQPDFPNSSPASLINVNGTLFFVALGSGSSKELHKTVGPAYDDASTSIVEDINPDSNGIAPGDLTNVNGTLFFAASNGAANNGYELWKSTDGTAANTDVVEDIAAGSGSSTPSKLTNISGTLLFSADDGSAGRELWKSTDGTAANTDIVENINPAGASSTPDNLTAIGTTLFFTADDGSTGKELWKSVPPYGIADTSRVADINPGPGDSIPASNPPLTNVNGTLFFQASDGVNGFELWKSNGGGLGSGTEMVKDIDGAGSSVPAGLANINGTLLFRATVGGDTELYKSDGTTAGTGLVMNINSGGSSFPFNMTNFNGMALFSADDGSVGRELWKATIEGPPAPIVTPPATPTPPAKKCKKGRKLKKGKCVKKKRKKK